MTLSFVNQGSPERGVTSSGPCLQRSSYRVSGPFSSDISKTTIQRRQDETPRETNISGVPIEDYHIINSYRYRS